MADFTSRTKMLLGKEATEQLAKKRVAVFGIGGVGGYVCEALARAGIGNLVLFDDDVVSLSNVNRQIVALRSTIGRAKVDVMKQRIADINPNCTVEANRIFYTPDTADEISFVGFDYIVDAVDTVSAKLEIIVRAKQAGVPVISAMGAGNKLYPEKLQVADIEKTSVCPLARVMRRELRKRRIKNVKVVYSQEEPRTPDASLQEEPSPPILGQVIRPGKPKKQTPGSVSFVPAAAGLLLAGAVVRDLAGL